ncbi:hypothetical protein EVAR_22980_1 [Eumeta japonica]|uniref:Uncharacterized protein n=1 Tax=Eumeta variegata TaxID=151549 RepID=A0A4C1UR62_EUMVA|nr:hypothetical protein EVAR_22980_1 [Eumeta japonica]
MQADRCLPTHVCRRRGCRCLICKWLANKTHRIRYFFCTSARRGPLRPAAGREFSSGSLNEVRRRARGGRLRRKYFCAGRDESRKPNQVYKTLKKLIVDSQFRFVVTDL